nr:ATP-dependent sacrificial sulfur transferase LarE [Saccharothrix deserti]
MDTGTAAARLVDHLRAIGPVAVAFSGGADSALVLAAAARATGPDTVLAVTADSASLATTELTHAVAFAHHLGVRHLAPPTTELDNPAYTANGRDRCYFCKSTVLDTITTLARDHGLHAVATGVNADDARDPFRPGIRAGDETGVHTPLRDTGMTKADVRAVSRLWNLPTWDKPATPCLASRVRYGLTITPARLARVQHAEAAVRTWLTDTGTPTHDLRVRDLGDTGRIELDPHLAHRPEIGPALTEIVRAAGFDNAELAVFRSGNLNHEPTRRTGGQVQRAADPGEQVVFPGSPAGRRRGVRCGRGGSGSRRGRCPSDSPCGVRTGRSAADRRTGTRGCHRNRWRVECAVVARRRSRVRSPVGCGRGAGRRPTVGRVAFDHAAAAPAVGGGGVVVVDPLPVPDLPAGSAAGQTLGEQPPHDRCRLGVGLGTATPRAATGLSGVEEHLHNAPSPAITSEATSTCHAFEVSGSWCSMVEVRPGTSDQRVQSSGNACVSRR